MSDIAPAKVISKSRRSKREQNPNSKPSEKPKLDAEAKAKVDADAADKVVGAWLMSADASQKRTDAAASCWVGVGWYWRALYPYKQNGMQLKAQEETSKQIIKVCWTCEEFDKSYLCLISSSCKILPKVKRNLWSLWTLSPDSQNFFCRKSKLSPDVKVYGEIGKMRTKTMLPQLTKSVKWLMKRKLTFKNYSHNEQMRPR